MICIRNLAVGTSPDAARFGVVVGRVRTSRQRREALLEEFYKSGVYASKFAQMPGNTPRP